MAAYEKFFFIFFLMFAFTSRKKYLQEKYWTAKEKAARAKTWAWKHDGNTNTFKGFYIPAILPHSDQGKFFQKKRGEDEERLWDAYLKKSKFEKKKIYVKWFYNDEKRIKRRKIAALLGLFKRKKNYLFDITNRGYSFWMGHFKKIFIKKIICLILLIGGILFEWVTSKKFL